MFKFNRLFYRYFIPVVVLSVLPILASGVLIFILAMANFDNLQKKLTIEIESDLRSEIYEKNLNLASLEGKKIEQVIDPIGGLLSVFSITPDFVTLSTSGISNNVENFFSENIPIIDFSVVDEWGSQLYKKSNAFFLYEINDDEAILSLLTQVKESKKAEISKVYFIQSAQKPYVILAQPIFDLGGNLKGIITASVNLDFISSSYKEEMDQSKGIVYIVSDEGYLISHPNMFEQTQNVDYSKYEFMQKILTEKLGSFELDNKFFSFYTTRYGWKAIVEIPTEIALSALKRNKSTINAFIKITLNSIYYSIIIVMIVVLAVSIVIAIYITNRTIKPILELTKASNKISEGNFDLRVVKFSSDEIGQLTDSFNIMADEISKKQNELVDKNNFIKKQADDLLQRYNSDLEQIAYVTTHDLVEPLRMITSYTQLLNRRHAHIFNEDAKEYMLYINEGVQRMHRIVNDLFEYSHIRTNESDFEETDVNEVLKTVETKIEQSIINNHAVIEYHDLPTIKAVKSNMVQVFQNLISNAIKFKSTERPCIIKIYYKLENSFWHFMVVDNGIGFDPKYADKVFEIFKRLNKRNEYPGSGMGLAICKNIVERHGGKIWVEPILNQGCTFHFTIKRNA